MCCLYLQPEGSQADAFHHPPFIWQVIVSSAQGALPSRATTQASKHTLHLAKQLLPRICCQALERKGGLRRGAGARTGLMRHERCARQGVAQQRLQNQAGSRTVAIQRHASQCDSSREALQAEDALHRLPHYC